MTWPPKLPSHRGAAIAASLPNQPGRQENTKGGTAMRKPMIIAVIVCAVTVGLAAQTPPNSPPQASKQVTFSGCIEKGPSDAAAAPATPAAEARATFILTNVSPAGSGAVGTTGGAKPATKYRLDVDDAKIGPHVGHKVEVTGTVDEQPGPASSPSGAAASASAGPKLKVDSIKMVAATCP
jgi:hypothetical protein